MQISSSAKHKQGAVTSLTTLYARHDGAASHFQQIDQENTLDSNSKELVNSLAKLHQTQLSALKELIEDLPDIPVKPNTDMRTPAYICEPEDCSNTRALIEHCLEHTESTHKLYRDILDNNGIPDGITAKLESHAQRLSEALEKLERLKSTGEERDMRV